MRDKYYYKLVEISAMKKLFLALLFAWIMIATVGVYAATNLGDSNSVEDMQSQRFQIIDGGFFPLP